MRLDKSVAALVKKLNRIYGVYPNASCGGHKNPKGSRCPIDEFYVIVTIDNPTFLRQLKELVEEFKSVSKLEYNPLYETWLLAGTQESKEYVYEPFVEEYLSTTKEYKPDDEWKLFDSYASGELVYAD